MNFIIKGEKLKAITIVETLIYLFLFALIFILVMEFVITLRANNQISLEKVNLEKVIIYINNHLSDSFKNNIGIDENNSIFASDSGKIRILKTAGYKEYTQTNGIFTYNDNGNTLVILDPDFRIDKLRFDKILDSNNLLQGIRMELRIVSVKNINNKKEIQTSFLLK